LLNSPPFPLFSLSLPVTDIVGGGHAVGTIVLVEEDRNTKFAELLLKYFVAEGITQENTVCLISAEEDPAIFLDCKTARSSWEKRRVEAEETLNSSSTSRIGFFRVCHHHFNSDKPTRYGGCR